MRPHLFSRVFEPLPIDQRGLRVVLLDRSEHRPNTVVPTGLSASRPIGQTAHNASL
jgi:hypothetical protein